MLNIPRMIDEGQAADIPAESPVSVFASRDAVSGLLLGVGVLLIVMVLMRGQMRKRPASSYRTERPQPMSTSDGNLLRLERAAADATELARSLAATLDNRALRLEALIEDAERAAARLEQASGHDQRDQRDQRDHAAFSSNGDTASAVEP